MAEAEVKVDYGDFTAGYNTITALNNDLSTQKTEIESCKSNLQDEAIFAGPIAESTGETLHELSNLVTLMTENFTVMANLLTQVGKNFKQADNDAMKIIFATKDGKFEIQKIASENQALVDAAMEELGKVRTDFDDNEFNRAFNENAWCADFLSLILKRQGYNIDWAINAGDENNANSILNAVKNAGGEIHYGQLAEKRGKTPDNYIPKAGDLFSIDTDGDPSTLEHVGMVVSVNDDKTFTSIEGNTYKEVEGYKEKFINSTSEDQVPGYVEVHKDRDMSKVYAWATPKK